VKYQALSRLTALILNVSVTDHRLPFDAYAPSDRATVSEDICISFRLLIHLDGVLK